LDKIQLALLFIYVCGSSDTWWLSMPWQCVLCVLFICTRSRRPPIFLEWISISRFVQILNFDYTGWNLWNFCSDSSLEERYWWVSVNVYRVQINVDVGFTLVDCGIKDWDFLNCNIINVSQLDGWLVGGALSGCFSMKQQRAINWCK